jgi:hypothetical protein
LHRHLALAAHLSPLEIKHLPSADFDAGTGTMKIVPWETIAKALWPNATQSNQLHPPVKSKK